MKIKNKGLTLSEMLCYIVIFSMLLSIITGFLLYIYDFNHDINTTEFEEVLFLEKLVTNIKDYKILNKEDIYIDVNNEESIVIKGVNTNQIYLSYNIKSNEMYNGLISKKIVFETLSLNFLFEENYILITNLNDNYHFLIEV